jgi:hypothetical protein
MGVEVCRGDPKENIPGKVIVVPYDVGQIHATDFDLNKVRQSYIRNALKQAEGYHPQEMDLAFLAEDSKSSIEFVHETIHHTNPIPA